MLEWLAMASTLFAVALLTHGAVKAGCVAQGWSAFLWIIVAAMAGMIPLLMLNGVLLIMAGFGYIKASADD